MKREIKWMVAIVAFCLAAVVLTQHEMQEAERKEDCASKGRISKHQTVYEKGVCWAVLSKDTLMPRENAVDMMVFSNSNRRRK